MVIKIKESDPNSKKIFFGISREFYLKLTIILGLFVIAVIAVIAAIILGLRSGLKNEETYKLHIISRAEWKAKNPPLHAKFDKLKHPVESIIIAHTVTGGNCTNQIVCSKIVLSIQESHLNAFGDIAYNFLVGGDGQAYEGIGWDIEGAHTKSFNRISLGIAFIGNFKDLSPPEHQLNVTQLLIQEAIHLGKLSQDYKLYGHRDLQATESPGSSLYKIIKTWPNWAAGPYTKP